MMALLELLDQIYAFEYANPTEPPTDLATTPDNAATGA